MHNSNLFTWLIVVLSRQRFSNEDTLFVTPSGAQRPSVTSGPTPTKSPLSMSSTAAGVPASGDIPRSWTINNYDPRRNRISIVENNDRHDLFFSSPSPPMPAMQMHASPSTPASFVTPLPKKSESPPSRSKNVLHPSTTEAMIERLRRDYKKRREFIQKQESAIRRSSDFLGPTVVPKSTPTPTTTTISSQYSKRPSIRFEAVASAEDRQFVVSPNSNYQIVHQQPAVETTTPYSTTSSSYLPPITTESHAYKEVHYVEKPSTTTYAPPTTTAYTAPTTTPSLYHPPPPTSLTPPLAKVYAVRPTVPATSTTLITTQGALLLPKNPKVPTFVTPITTPLENSLYGSGPVPAPAIIVVQAATQNEAEKDMKVKNMSTEEAPITTTPMSTTTTTSEETRIVFPETTELASLTKYDDEMEITERITGNSGQVTFNDTQFDRASGMQQSINLKINVIVENDSDDSKETSEDYELLDSVPKASTSPTIPLQNGNYIKLAPLSYTSSSSFRSKAPPPATLNDYMYDSELGLEDFYYYDDSYELDEDGYQEVTTRPVKPKQKKEVEITDKELFELYDDLSEILEDMEASLARTTTTSKPKWQEPSVSRDDAEKQNIYEFIRSKPLKTKPKKSRQTYDVIQFKSTPRPLQNSRKRRRRKKNYLKMEYYPMASIKTYGRNPTIATTTEAPYHQQRSYYNLTEDLIPDLRGVSQPSDWNVRDFTQWENVFFPRLGVMPARITPELDEPAKPEKQRKAVTFDKLLKTSPNHREINKFSRLIRHDKNFAHRSDDDYYYDDEYREEPWPQYSHYTRMPRDSFFRDDERENYPLPSFDISFDEWLAEAGVTSSFSNFRNQKPFWDNPEGLVLHR